MQANYRQSFRAKGYPVLGCLNNCYSICRLVVFSTVVAVSRLQETPLVPMVIVITIEMTTIVHENYADGDDDEHDDEDKDSDTKNEEDGTMGVPMLMPTMLMMMMMMTTVGYASQCATAIATKMPKQNSTKDPGSGK